MPLVQSAANSSGCTSAPLPAAMGGSGIGGGAMPQLVQGGAGPHSGGGPSSGWGGQNYGGGQQQGGGFNNPMYNNMQHQSKQHQQQQQRNNNMMGPSMPWNNDKRRNY